MHFVQNYNSNKLPLIQITSNCFLMGDYFRLVVDLVSRSWFTGSERSRIRDEDRDLIDRLIIIMDVRAYIDFYANTSEGINTALNDLEFLGAAIENCRPK